MRRIFKCVALGIMANILSVAAFAQSNTIKGSVIDSNTSEAVPAVSVTVKGSGAGTYTDDKGNFSLNPDHPLPLTLIVSSIGYTLKEVQVSRNRP